ncbi:zf-CCHC domain-containing protein/UBN2 domain-containing protein [Cephalotus follicularis]|uniref:Zf-CCHC domain-containing protein/UBN2 domain-containing protein n=1 Tax=Cephalotus follicularis TaxID=3775 RepID=A0A1Q3CI45_CEPFO|nr:zf-CCHC domain-containing protein/UBN2 domain-containing protein [Cephalotus follicularis]
MEIYLKSRDFRNWLSVKNGPHIPTKLNDKNELVSKSEDEWDEDDFRKLTIDNKALNILLVSLDKTEYNLVRRCTSAHEVWKLLILTHEGTEQVKNAKLALLNRDYELFKMQSNESIKNLYNRLVDITNGLLGLGKVFGKDVLVRKLLGCLNDEWEPKVTAIEESKCKNPNFMKDIALKSTHKEEVSSEEELEEEDYVLSAKRFTKIAKMNKARRFQKKNFNKGEGSKMDPPTCFECNKPGHIKVDCPQLKKKKLFKKKALNAWHLSDDDSSDDEVTDQVANLCFMALSDTEDSDNEVDDSYTFGELLVEFKKKCSQCSSLKKNIVNIENEKDLLGIENEKLKSELSLLKNDIAKPTPSNDIALEKEVEALKEKNVNLEKSFSKFTLGSKKLEEMLGSQRSYLDKTGIGYAPLEVKAKLKNAKTRPHCTYCNKIGHVRSKCFKRIAHSHSHTRPSPNHNPITFRQVWVPKGTVKQKSNYKGTNKQWVPRSKSFDVFVGGSLLASKPQ